MKAARATPHYCALILWKTRRNSSDMDMPFPPLVFDYCIHTSRSESLSAASALRRYGVDTSAGGWISDCEPSGGISGISGISGSRFTVESVELPTLLAFRERRHDAHPPRAGGVAFEPSTRLIMAPILLPGPQGIHTPS